MTTRKPNKYAALADEGAKLLRITPLERVGVAGVQFEPGEPVLVQTASPQHELQLRACRALEVEYVRGEPYRPGDPLAGIGVSAPTRVVEAVDG